MDIKEHLQKIEQKIATKINVLVLSLLTVILVFIVDLVTPYGAIHWIFYLIPLFFIYRTGKVSYTIITLISISVFLVLGGIFQPNEFPKPESIPLIDYTNRFEGFFAFALFTYIISSLIKSRNHFQILSAQLEQGVNAIAVEHERLAVTLRSIGDGVITTDAQGNIDIMNNVAENLCGWNQNEAKGKPLVSVFNIVNEVTRIPHIDPFKEVLSLGKIIELANHTVIISKDGIERVIADSAAPIRDRSNMIIGVVIVFRDISEKQKLIETSQRNQKLESLGLLAGGIAHDFNNLMGGILGYIDIALAESTNKEVSQSLSKAMNTIDRAKGLTQQLLTFSKGGAPNKKIGYLFPFVQETAQFVISGSNVSCSFDIPQDLWACDFDKSQIGQVIDNLVINAQQAMPNGGSIKISALNITLEEKIHPSLPPGNYVKISIKDFGIGIPSEVLPRIFDPFFTTKAMGHGLGLTTANSIINRHGGCIDVESQSNNGSTFHVFIPASIDPVLRSQEEMPAVHKGSGTILLMDDEEVIRETVNRMLGFFGYIVVCKVNGRETIDYFMAQVNAGQKFAALIFDLTIPGGLGGKEIIKEIRKINPEIPVFVASGYAQDPVIANPKEYGFTASISKPFTMAELAKLFNKYLT